MHLTNAVTVRLHQWWGKKCFLCDLLLDPNRRRWKMQKKKITICSNFSSYENGGLFLRSCCRLQRPLQSGSISAYLSSCNCLQEACQPEPRQNLRIFQPHWFLVEKCFQFVSPHEVEVTVENLFFWIEMWESMRLRSRGYFSLRSGRQAEVNLIRQISAREMDAQCLNLFLFQYYVFLPTRWRRG